MFVDGTSNVKGIGGGLLFENDHDLRVEAAIRFKLPNSNNQAEYEACLDIIHMSSNMGVEEVVIKSDSKFVILQVQREYHAKGTTINNI